METYAASHIGNIREENEDTVLIASGGGYILAIVADGMGGHAGGKKASMMAAKHMQRKLRREEEVMPRRLRELVEETSREVFEAAEANENYKNMGSTLELAVVYSDMVIAAHVGDSRAYMLRRGRLDRLTRDHSYVQYLVDNGYLSPEEAEVHPYKNIITRAIGMKEVEVDVYSTAFEEGYMLLLCSDGLTRHVKDSEIEARLNGEGTIRDKVEDLIDLALERGGMDNITIALISNEGEEK